MESQKQRDARQGNLLKLFSSLPNKMLALHHDERLIERVLYDLAHKDCFNFSKAAYLIDNPHFNCLQGVAGFSRNEHTDEQVAHWENPQSLYTSMDESLFHKKVRGLSQVSLGDSLDTKPEALKDIAQALHLKNPYSYSWKTKHDNHGILLFEHDHPGVREEYSQELLSGVSLLGFCPVY